MPKHPKPEDIRDDVLTRLEEACPDHSLRAVRCFDKSGIRIQDEDGSVVSFVSYDWYRGEGAPELIDAASQQACEAENGSEE